MGSRGAGSRSPAAIIIPIDLQPGRGREAGDGVGRMVGCSLAPCLSPVASGDRSRDRYRGLEPHARRPDQGPNPGRPQEAHRRRQAPVEAATGRVLPDLPQPVRPGRAGEARRRGTPRNDARPREQGQPRLLAGVQERRRVPGPLRQHLRRQRLQVRHLPPQGDRDVGDGRRGEQRQGPDRRRGRRHRPQAPGPVAPRASNSCGSYPRAAPTTTTSGCKRTSTRTPRTSATWPGGTSISACSSPRGSTTTTTPTTSGSTSSRCSRCPRRGTGVTSVPVGTSPPPTNSASRSTT